MACVDDRLFIFGGDNGTTVLNELYEFKISSREWNLINISDSGPTHRTGHGFASALGNLYVFGGLDRSGDSEHSGIAYTANNFESAISLSYFFVAQDSCKMIYGS
jgi:N-acetylneuraminic acid mutarotase